MEGKSVEDVGEAEDVLSLCNLRIDGYESEDSSIRRGRASASDDVLSLCNIPIDGYESEDSSLRRGRASTSSEQDLFEFVPGNEEGEEMNEYRKRDYFCVRSASFRKAPEYQLTADEDREFRQASPNHSNSLWSPSSDPSRSGRYSPVPKVNITALTSMSAKSRRRMFMFGPVKFKPEMDVNAIRRRQGRRPPMQIPAIPEGNEIVAVGGAGKEKSSVDGGLPRPLWYKSHLAAALAKSMGCVPNPMG